MLNQVLQTSRAFYGPWLLLVILITGLIGCESGNAKLVSEQNAALQELLDFLESIDDPQSAKAAVPQIGPLYSKAAETQIAVVLASDSQGKIKMSQRYASPLGKQVERLVQEVEKQNDRLKKAVDFPDEFCDEIRLHTVKAVVSILDARIQAGQFQNTVPESVLSNLRTQLEMFEEYGPGQVVELQVDWTGSINRPDFLESLDSCLSTIAGPNVKSTITELAEGPIKLTMSVAPVNDYDNFVNAIDFADIKFNNPPARSLSITFPRSMHQDEIVFSLSTCEWETRKNRGGAQYFEWMAGKFTDWESPINRLVRQELRNTNPDEVTDEATRQKIIEGFGKLVYNPSLGPSELSDHYFSRGGSSKNFERYRVRSSDEEYTAPYVRWAGADAVGFVTGFIDHKLESRHPSQRRVPSGIYQALRSLGKIGTQEAADALIAYWNDPLVGGSAADSLGDMGSLAEDAFLHAVRKGQLQDDERILRIMDRLGTNKSLELLYEYKEGMVEENARLENVIRRIERRKGEPVDPQFEP